MAYKIYITHLEIPGNINQVLEQKRFVSFDPVILYPAISIKESFFKVNCFLYKDVHINLFMIVIITCRQCFKFFTSINVVHCHKNPKR